MKIHHTGIGIKVVGAVYGHTGIIVYTYLLCKKHSIAHTNHRRRRCQHHQQHQQHFLIIITTIIIISMGLCPIYCGFVAIVFWFRPDSKKQTNSHVSSLFTHESMYYT